MSLYRFWLRKADKHELSTLLGDVNAHHYPIEVVIAEMNDLWIRDTGPTFVFNEEGHKAGINLISTSTVKKKKLYLTQKQQILSAPKQMRRSFIQTYFWKVAVLSSMDWVRLL